MIRRALLTLAAYAWSIPAFASSQAAVAVVFDTVTIRPVLAEGEADHATHRLVGPDDPVRIASISKLVTALGVMRLVDQGQVDLDRDVSDYLGWTLRHPAFPDRPITLAMLLSHQSGLIDGDDLYLIPLGATLQQRLGDPRVWDQSHAPGSGWFHYTNLNFPVVATIIEQVTRQRFDVAMRDLVLAPLKLDACFNWGAGCSASAAARAVVLYRANGDVARDDLHGTFPACPVVTDADGGCDLWRYTPGSNGALFSPQGGLRISMRDLSKIGQMLARRGTGFLSQQSYARLIRPIWRFNGHNGLGENGEPDGFFCAYGLAVQTIGSDQKGCRDDLFGDARTRIGHAGDAYGLKSGLWLDPASGKGIAYFTTGVANDAPTGRSAFTAAEEVVVERTGRSAFYKPD
ncbi:serine hydrolase [Novosphingobium sp.]|uniref:serine hydrolase domain-containing protein n=1 Tax=Novosphingobium sp. TaxID=1874826 RepID=UPI0025E08662|nr:serine hydrolase domain-containing protein [Novosphingobium sp.]